MMKTRNKVMISLGMLLGMSASVSAKTESHPDAALRALSLIDQWVTKDQLIEAGIDTDGQALVEIALDSDLPGYTRIRATSMLAVFDSAAARAGALRIIDAPDIRVVEIKVQAVRAHAELNKLHARPKLETLLTDERPELRAAAVRALAKLELRAPLEARLSAEPESWVRALIARKLGR